MYRAPTGEGVKRGHDVSCPYGGRGEERARCIVPLRERCEEMVGWRDSSVECRASPQSHIESLVNKMSATTATSAKGQTAPAHVGMFQLLNGVFVAGAIACVARLGIADL